jgi:hypothetical protein
LFSTVDGTVVKGATVGAGTGAETAIGVELTLGKFNSLALFQNKNGFLR